MLSKVGEKSREKRRERTQMIKPAENKGVLNERNKTQARLSRPRDALFIPTPLFRRQANANQIHSSYLCRLMRVRRL